MDHASRRARLRDLVRQRGLAALLVTGASNVRYLTGLVASNAQVVVMADGSDVLVTDERYRGAAEPLADAGLLLDVRADAVGAALTRVGRGRLGVEAAHLSWSAARRLAERAGEVDVAVEPTEGLVEDLRAIKDDAEVVLVAAACAATVSALAWLIDGPLRAGATELELARALEARFLTEGADGVGFASIVAAGPHGAVPHHRPTDRPIARGELVTIDCGATVEGYHADLTRTVAVGSVTGELAEVHDLVAAAARAGRAAVRAGATTGAVDASAREVIAQAGRGEAFVHPTGHGVGLDIHEAPAVAPGATATLHPGATLTVEPGVYLPGVGGVRIEDTLVVGPDGVGVPLTDLPRGR
jgi:Xaa-Pro aminopeptidase